MSSLRKNGCRSADGKNRSSGTRWSFLVLTSGGGGGQSPTLRGEGCWFTDVKHESPTLLWLYLLIQIWRWVGKMEEGTTHYLIFWDLLVNQSIPWDPTGNSYMFPFLKWVSQVALVVKNLPANAGNIRDAGFILGGGHGNPLQYSCLEDPMFRGAWDYSP